MRSPESFVRTIASLGIQIESEQFFPDHYQYAGADLSALLDPPGLVLTTEKDISKIPADRYPDLWYLRIGIRLNEFRDPLSD